MRKSLMLILNPSAGKGGGISSVGRIIEVLYAGGYTPTVYYTESVGDATRLVLQNAKRFDCVTCVGGDGTLSETVAGLAQLDSPPLLGYIPQGTTNDVATTLRLPKFPSLAARTVVTGRSIPFDVGKFNDDAYFTYIAAFGAFTEVSYETPKESKQALGHLAYVLKGMEQLPKLTFYPTSVEYDGGTISGDMIFGSVSNSSSVAGIVKLSSDQIALNDGLFEVVLVKNPKNVLEMNQIVSSILSKSFTGGMVTMLKSKNVKFTFDRPVKWTRDGEAGGAHKQVRLENLHSAINFIVKS